ncbi:MAG: LLM class flavin-dependent oxidoreductase, partial [Dehalococcoidia bacterium]|nr:LLM class flavin-dependent oxidoreductase [Dehalococcoidia bacterium]
MKLGLSVGYSGAQMQLPVEKIQQVEALGYDSVWTAEAYGSDAITPLAYLAAVTKHIRLGTGIIQVSARSAAATAMAMQTLDALAGGNRVIAGLGVSGPQIVEGWYGQPWGKPYWMLRDYIEIMKKIGAREGPVEHQGREYTLPYDGPGSQGLGKPLQSILHTNPDLPIWLGSGSESNVRLAAQFGDGLLPLGFVPSRMPEYMAWINEGFERAGGGKSMADFEIQTSVSVEITDDISGALRR